MTEKMTDKNNVYRFIIENPEVTDVDLLTKFNTKDGIEQNVTKGWKNDCLEMLAILDEIKQEKSKSENKKAMEGIIEIINEKRSVILQMIKWFEVRSGNTYTEISGQSKRITLHLNLDLINEARALAKKQIISSSRLADRAVFIFRGKDE